MSKYWAEIDSDNQVLRVVVCDSLEWLQNNLGGTWVETSDPYASGSQAVTYCGIGFGYDPEFPEKFARPWRQPIPGIDDEDGSGMGYPHGTLTFHNGRIWRSTVDGNVWEPGVSAWHDAPQIDGVLPTWVPPTGGHDTYPEGFELMHNGQHYISERADNVWEPGTADSGWALVTDDPEPGDVIEWAAGQTVSPGDERSYQDTVYVCLQGHTTQAGWEPPSVPSLWSVAD